MTTKTKSKPRRRIAAPRGPAVPDIIQNQRTWMDANASQAAPIAGIAADDIHNIVPAMYQAWGAYGYQPALTWYQLANMYVSWEYTATEKIARTLASLPAKLYRYENAAGKTLKPYFVKSLTFAERLKQSTPERIAYKLRKDHGIKRVEIDDHPFLDLVNAPNPDMVRFNFWRLLAIHLELNGAVGIYKARIDGFGNPTELYILPTTWTGQLKPVPATDGVRLIKEYRLLDQNINESFTLDEIIWIHYTSLRNPFEGMSALKAQLYSFNMDTYLMQQINAFYKNGAMFSNVFSTEARMTQKEYNEIAAQLTNYQGAKNAGQKFILHSGLKMEKPLNATARESMVDAIEKMARDKMLSSHDLSAGKIGLVESQNRSNLETVDMGFFNEAIKPRAMLITEYFDQYLVKNYDDNLDFEFDYPHFQDRAQDISERQSNIVNGLTTRNEERDKMGLEPIDGGDIILVSPMNVPLSSVVNPPEPPPVAAVDSGNGGAPDGGTAPTEDNGNGKPIVNDTKGGPSSGRYPKGSGKGTEGTGADIDISAVEKFINENEENGYIENPFPPVKENIARELSDLELLQYDTTISLEEKFKDIKPELVNLKNLRNPSESEIETDNLIHLAKAMADNDLDLRNDPIHVVAYKGSKVLIDGNHRATACQLGGLTTIYAQVLNVNDKGQIYKTFKGGPGSGRYPEGSGESATNVLWRESDKWRKYVDAKGYPINPIDKNATMEEKVEQLRALGEENKELVDPILAEFDKQYGTKSDSRVKEAPSIIGKATRPSKLEKNPEWSVEHLQDGFGFRTGMNSPEDIEAGLRNILDKIPEASIVEANFDQKDPESGWRMASFNIRMPNGLISEFDFTYPEMIEEQLHGGGHKIYEKWRVVSREERNNRKDEYAEDMVESRRLYGDAWNAGLTRGGISQTDFDNSVNKIRASFSETQLKSSCNSSGSNVSADHFPAVSRNQAFDPLNCSPKKSTARESSLPLSASTFIKPPVVNSNIQHKTKQNKLFWNSENKLLAWKKFDREATAYEPLFRRVMVKFFRDVNAQVQDKLEKHGVKIKSNIGAMGLNGRQKWLADHKDRLNEFLPGKDALKKRLKADMKPIYLSVLEQSGKGRVEEFSRYMPKKTKDVDAEIDFEYDVYDPEVVKWLGNRLEEFSETTAQTTINDTKRTLREDFENGEPLMKMGEHLRDYFEGAETYRANLIARTESTASMNEGDMTAVSQMGLGDSVGKVWLAEPDPLTRATHAAAGERYADGTDAETGEPMTLDKEFNVGEDKMLHPAGGQIAEENCNCRCGMVYEMLDKTEDGGDLDKSFFDKGGPGSGRYPAGSGDRPNQHHDAGYYEASGESAHGEGEPEGFEGEPVSELITPITKEEALGMGKETADAIIAESRKLTNDQILNDFITMQIGMSPANLAEWDKLDLDVQQEIHAAFVHSFMPYREYFNSPMEIKFKDAGQGILASHSFEGSVNLNPKYFNEPDDMRLLLEAAVESGYHPAGCDTIKSIVDHELGHHFHTQSDEQYDKAEKDARSMRQAKGGLGYIANDISQYAADPKHPREFLAESFSMRQNAPRSKITTTAEWASDYLISIPQGGK